MCPLWRDFLVCPVSEVLLFNILLYKCCCITIVWVWFSKYMYTVEPPIKDTPNKEHLSIKDKSTRPNSYYTSTF